jgi:dipeptidyl aminopeptidase/acylaminoacyl peptidase
MVLTRAINSNSGLYIANLKNGKLTRVADDPEKSEGWGAWCRLGRKIAYTQESINSSSQLWRVDRDGSNKTRLGSSENVGIGKDWCPLGLRIIYSAKNSKEKDDLWAIDWYGTNETQITDTSYGEWNPAFSPDGKKIVYVSDEGDSPEIWIRDIDGHYRARLTNNLGIVGSNPKWSPDGSKIVFTARNLHNTLEVSPINGTDVNSIDYLNNSMNNSSDSSNNLNYNSESSEVDGYEIIGSDIAVIKLSFSSAVSPIPKLTGFRIDSLSGIFGEKAASITITAKNEGKNSSEGYIWVSFPEEKEIENVEGTGSNITIYNSGSFLKSKEGEVLVQYPLVEMVEYDWNRGQEESLNVKLVPGNETEEIIFFVRAGLKDDLTGNYSRDPLVSDTVDQQGFEVYRYSTHIS